MLFVHLFVHNRSFDHSNQADVEPVTNTSETILYVLVFANTGPYSRVYLYLWRA